MNTVRNTKNQMRSEYLEKRAGISAETRRAWDEKICKVFLSLASYRFSDVVLAYLPSGGEIDIRPVLFDALAKGKRVALPRSAEGEAMDFYFITREELENHGRCPHRGLPCRRFNQRAERDQAGVFSFDFPQHRTRYARSFPAQRPLAGGRRDFR